jgi:hypothetical protein
MKPTATNRRVPRRAELGLSLGLLLTLAIIPAATAEIPIDPLPAPDYSFDLLSCSVDEGIVEAGDILNVDLPDPNILLYGEMLGLFSTEDDLNALSAANPAVDLEQTFALLLSVHAATVGVAPPDPALIELYVPYNVTDQATRGHAAGDQFMSTRLFTRSGVHGGEIYNNVLDRNNYDEGGTDFSAQPPTSAYEYPQDELLDVVDATARLERVGGVVTSAYFSLTPTSPALEELPFYIIPSGADIFYNSNPTAWAPTELYAAHDYLQLDEDDDIDALIVFDDNHNGSYDGTDQVLFSLAPGSPSLETIPGASEEGAAADIFSVTYDQAPVLFAAAAELGLGNPQDNIDALDFVFCDDALFCAAQHGIRSIRGDLDGDCDVDLADLAKLLAGYDTCAGDQLYDPVADIDTNGCVDLADLAIVLSAYGTSCE